MIIGFGNNTVSSLAADITANQTTIQVMPGEGAKFAKLLSSDYVNTSNPLKIYAKITLTDAKETVFEVCHLTAVNNDMLTVIRGQEGTTAKGWALNDVVANFATRGSENQFVQIEQLQSGNYTSGVAGGSANALTIELPATYFVNSSTDWALRVPIVVYPTQNNTGASTLQLVMGGRVLGTFPLYKGNKAQLVANDILKDVGLVCLMDKTKTFFNVANPGAIYAGLGTAAFYDVQKSPADATPNRLLPVGAFGLGAENTPVANINADAMRVSGFYGGPGVSGVNYYDPYAALLVMSRYNTDGGMMQISANGKAAVRGRGFDKLSNWNELFGKLNPPTAQDCNALPSDGTALAANKLATARTIAGVSFDGTRNIDIPAGNVGAYTKAEVNSLIPTSSISGTSVKTFIWMGIMIQVGRVNGSESSSTELTLPVAFKSYAQVLGSVDAASGNGVNAGVNMIGLGKIAFTRAGQYGPLTFLAIGDV